MFPPCRAPARFRPAGRVIGRAFLGFFVVANASELRASQQTTDCECGGSNYPRSNSYSARTGIVVGEPGEPGGWRPEPPQRAKETE